MPHNSCLTKPMLGLMTKMQGIAKQRRFVLAGGTALAVHLRHRLSVDLDFFTDRMFQPQGLYREINAKGLQGEIFQEDEGTLSLVLEGVKVSFLYYPYSWAEPFIEHKGISVAGTLDIAAMKVMAITQRGAKRDFVDLYFILKDTPFRKVAEAAVKKYGARHVNPVRIGKSLVYFTDAETDPSPRYPGYQGPAWPDIKHFFEKNVRSFVWDLNNAVQETGAQHLPPLEKGD